MGERTVTDATAKAIEQTIGLAKDNGQSLAEPIHLASVLCTGDDSIGNLVCTKIPDPSVDINVIRRNLQRMLLKKPSQTPPPMDASPSNALQLLLARATKAAKANGDSLVALDHLFAELYGDKDASAALTEGGLTKKLAIETLKEIRGGRKVTSASAEDQYEALEKYGIDLVQAAADGKLDPGKSL